MTRHTWMTGLLLLGCALLLFGCDSVAENLGNIIVYNPPSIDAVAFSPETDVLDVMVDYHNGDDREVKIHGWYHLPTDPVGANYPILFRDAERKSDGAFTILDYAWPDGDEWRTRPADTEYTFEIYTHFTTREDASDTNYVVFSTTDRWRSVNGVMERIAHDTDEVAY
jgi:hypothetical protein